MRERDHLEDPGVDRRIILRWIFRKWDVGGMDWIDLAQVACSCKCDNEPSGTVTCGEFIDQLGTHSFSRRTLLHGVSLCRNSEQQGILVHRLL